MVAGLGRTMTPMQLSPALKTVVILLLIAGAFAYALLIEFAINAGRVHRGVSVQGYDIGGLNYTEAVEALSRRGRQLKAAPMIFTAEGFVCRFRPGAIGWGPQPSDTADAAMEIGRAGGVVQALRERLESWREGVAIRWGGSPDPAKMDRELDRCEEQAGAAGVEIDRSRLRYVIEEAIVTWPRPPFTIPLVR